MHITAARVDATPWGPQECVVAHLVDPHKVKEGVGVPAITLCYLSHEALRGNRKGTTGSVTYEAQYPKRASSMLLLHYQWPKPCVFCRAHRSGAAADHHPVAPQLVVRCRQPVGACSVHAERDIIISILSLCHSITAIEQKQAQRYPTVIGVGLTIISLARRNAVQPHIGEVGWGPPVLCGCASPRRHIHSCTANKLGQLQMTSLSRRRQLAHTGP